MRQDYTIVGLVGHAGAGKDTAAVAMQRLGYEPLKFAGPLKAMLRAYLDYVGVIPETIERMIEGDLKEAPSLRLGGRTPRHAMQTLGTEWGRNAMHEDLWIRAAIARAAMHQRVVFTDCRFPNEAQAIHDIGGAIVKIQRPGLTVSLEHPSERFIAGINADLTLVNDTETPERFQAIVGEWFAAAIQRGEA